MAPSEIDTACGYNFAPLPRIVAFCVLSMPIRVNTVFIAFSLYQLISNLSNATTKAEDKTYNGISYNYDFSPEIEIRSEHLPINHFLSDIHRVN